MEGEKKIHMENDLRGNGCWDANADAREELGRKNNVGTSSAIAVRPPPPYWHNSRDTSAPRHPTMTHDE